MSNLSELISNLAHFIQNHQEHNHYNPLPSVVVKKHNNWATHSKTSKVLKPIVKKQYSPKDTFQNFQRSEAYFEENFLIDGHEEGSVGKRHMKNASQGGFYATENLSKPLAQSRTSVLWSFLRQRTDEGTSQLGVCGDNLIALAKNYLSNGNYKINH